ncbi:PF20097 family protein [Tissierellaceae bacterium HCP3S3_D8]
MKCPFCNNDMVSGLLHGRGGGAFFWIPEDEEISIFFNCTVKNVNKKMASCLIPQHMVD